VAGRKDIRKKVVLVLSRVFKNKGGLEKSVNDTIRANKNWDKRDRSFFTFLVYGTYKRQITISWILEKIYGGRVYLTEELKAVIFSGIFQIFYSNVPEYAVVDEMVEIAKSLGGIKAGNFTNFILRKIVKEGFPDLPENEIEAISIEYSHPVWLVKRWRREVGEFFKKILISNLKNKQIHLRLNVIKGVNNAKMKLYEEDIEYEGSPYISSSVRIKDTVDIMNASSYREGYITPQDEASQIISFLVDPRKDENILDVFAGRGNKTTHILELSNNKTNVFSLDRSKEKLKVLKENVKRLGLKVPHIINEEVENFKPDLKFDKILFDGPCTGLGTLRRKPEILFRLKEKDIRKSSLNLYQLLDIIKNWVKVGGSIVYSVCSFEKEEGEGLIKKFLSRNKNFEIENTSSFIPEKAKVLVRKRFFYTIPGVDDVDGFFAVRLLRLC